MADRIKYRFHGRLQDWLRRLVAMQLISEEEEADAAGRAAADAEVAKLEAKKLLANTRLSDIT